MLAEPTRHLHKLLEQLSLELHQQEENFHGYFGRIFDHRLDFPFQVFPQFQFLIIAD